MGEESARVDGRHDSRYLALLLGRTLICLALGGHNSLPFTSVIFDRSLRVYLDLAKVRLGTRDLNTRFTGTPLDKYG
jgi:hypothetical protein